MKPLPSGSITFLFTDIEDSTGTWERDPDRMRTALAAHDDLIAEVVVSHDGVVVKHMGDGCWAAFSTAPNAADAAVEFQRRHQGTDGGTDLRLKVRIGLHTGAIEPTDNDYFGPMVNRSARVVDLANGDQIVCSSATAGLLDQVELRNEGGHELRGIGSDEIYLILSPDIDTDPRPLRRPVQATNLPRPRTSLLGRADDVAAAQAYLTQQQQVLTLVGPGGVGKTRLAIEVATGLKSSFAERVYFCDLVPLADNDADALGEAVAEIVGARRQPGMNLVRSIADHLSGRPTLIVLDNCEHVHAAVRDLVEVIAEAQGVQVLATSREALGLADEQQIIVNPLTAATTGVELFVDRATQRDPQFKLDAGNEAAVRSIVQRLDGIPLAIELAAARIRLLSPAELDTRLDEGFRVLGRQGSRDRHETLQETVRWSYDLLAPPEAALFTRLCTFAGGFDLEAVEAVCPDDELVHVDEIPDLLLALVDKSMVVSNHVGRHRRFTLLETLRAFAAEELGASDPDGTFQRRHADHFRDLAKIQGRRFWSAAEPDAWLILDAEWTNLRTAAETYERQSDVDAGAELIVSLAWYGCTAMRFELFSWADALLATAGIEAHRRYVDLCGVGALGAYFMVHGSPTELAEAGLAADSADPEGFCHIALAAVAMNNTQDPKAADAVTLSWLATEPSTIGGKLWSECFRIFYLCTYAPGPEADERAKAARQTPDTAAGPTAGAMVDWAGGQARSYADLGEAIEMWHRGLEQTRSLPGDHLLTHLLDGLILHLTVRTGDVADSLRGCRDALRGALDRHYFAGTSHLFGVTAIALCRADDAPTGARLVGAMTANGHQPRRNATRTLHEALGDDLDAQLKSGHGLSITQAGHQAITALEAALARLDTVTS